MLSPFASSLRAWLRRLCAARSACAELPLAIDTMVLCSIGRGSEPQGCN
jgi:hypothetical protein